MENQDDAAAAAIPATIGKPAMNALSAAGISRLEQLTAISEAELLRLHGVGPKAVRLLRDALAARGLAFAAPPYASR